jgi:spermidine synthase
VFPLLLVLFCASGCAALIYEIVWLQLLQLVIGSTAVSMAVLLSAYMGGLCVGSFLLPRVIPERVHPLRVYGWIEAGIGISGIAVLFLVPLSRYVYAAGIGLGLPGMALRGLVAGVCLLAPTVLMGASLPALARLVEGTGRVGFLYAANTAGAVLGCLAAGFWLLRVLDMPTASCVAAGMNVAIAVVSFCAARGFVANRQSGRGVSSRITWIHVAIALSGMTALGAEVVWTRLLSLLIGATVYTFSIILAVFLAGIGLGSAAGSRVTKRPRIWLGVSQFLLAGSIAWTAAMIYTSLPYWPINPSLTRSPWITFQLDLVRCLYAILPGTLLWGASFPLALTAAAREGEDPGALAGGIYAANTIGAIAGAIGFSLLAIPAFGTQHAQQLLILLSVVAGCVAMRSLRWPVWAGVAIAGLLAWSMPALPWELVAYGRRLPSSMNRGNALYVGEGINSSIAVSQWSDGKRLFHISGKTEASTEDHDLRLERMLGHIPAMLHPAPHSVLVVGFGAGITAGSFVPYPEIRRIVICEMEPLVPPTTTRYFGRENYNVLHDPRTEIVYDDARHYMLTAREKFDIITSDPIHPWVKGSATLYSKEYFELVKARLNPGGRVTQWVPLYDSDMATVKSEVATFFESFPNGTVWSNDVAQMGYDMVMLGEAEPLRVDVAAMQKRLERPEYGRVMQSLKDVKLGSALELLSVYSGRRADFTDWLKGAEINRDRNLRLQYLAGMGVDDNASFYVYYEMMRRFRYPEDLFVISDEQKPVLKKMLGFTK